MKVKWLKRISDWLENKALVLMYHRVADLLFDPFELAVSPENFEQQLRVLKKNFRVIPVNELVDRLRKGSVSSRSVCLTFDDGYCDNYGAAMPLLEQYQCPATFYIASAFIGKKQLYWWDELHYILFYPLQLPSTLSLDIHGERLQWGAGNPAGLTEEQRQRERKWLFGEPPVSDRCALYEIIWKRIRPLPLKEIQQVLNTLKAWANVQPYHAESFPMTEEQLETIARNPLFEIGVHTATHPSLPYYNFSMQYEEIEDCKKNLEIKYNRPMQTISFPYGDYNKETLEIVRQKKLAGAFTTQECIVTRRTNPVTIGRFQVHNWKGDVFEKKLNGWLKK